MTLIAIGGAEDKEGAMIVLRRLIAEAGGLGARICVVTTATQDPAGAEARYRAAFAKLGITPQVLHVDSRAAADAAMAARAVGEADAVFFTGGDQLRLTSLLGGTEMMRKLAQNFHDGKTVIAGTSAGAAAASSLMIYGGDPAEALKKGAVQIGAGFGFAPDTVIDTHFGQRNRLARLFNAVAANPAVTGIGLDEDTAIVLSRDGVFEVIGNGAVTVVDGTGAKQPNIAEIGIGEVIDTHGMSVRRLTAGGRYDLARRGIAAPGAAERKR